MIIEKFLASLIIYYIFVLLQSSFLVHFSVLGINLNLILISVVIWNIFESSKKSFGLINAIIGGVFLDIYSNQIFGFYILISLSLAVFVKFFLKKYVKIPFIKEE